MIKVSLETFLSTGVFGPFVFGTTREEVERILGPCDYVIERQEGDSRHDWLEYPEVAFEFSPVQAGLTGVRLRQSPDYEVGFRPAPPRVFEERVELDPWVICWMTPQSAIEDTLRGAGLAVWPLESPMPGLVEYIEVGRGGTVLGFDAVGDFPGLAVISSERGPHVRRLPRFERSEAAQVRKA